MPTVVELATQAVQSLADAYHAQIKTLITPVYNVVGYGANGDGVTDDTTAIQAAIDAIPSSGGMLFLPMPTAYYKTTGVLNISKPIIVQGVGQTESAGVQIINTNTTGAHVFAVTSQGVAFRDLFIQGTAGGGDGINLTGTVKRYLELTRVYIKSCQRGIYAGSAAHLIRMTDVTTHSCRAGGFVFSNESSTGLAYIHGTNCWARANTGHGWDLIGIGEVNLYGCAADENTQYGFSLANVSGVVSGCQCEVNTQRGFSVDQSEGLTLANPRTYSQLAPFYVNTSGRVTLINPITVATPSGNSLNIGAGVLAVDVINKNFDMPVFDATGTALTLLDSSGFQLRGGTNISRHLSAAATLTFASIPAQSTAELTITVTGAAVGDTCYATPPGMQTNLVWCAYVSAADTVAVRVGNVSAAAITPSAVNWRVDVWKH